jgi:peptidoglycan/xylan/chitin deacetylase (PgdA/CDA1 family)
MSINADGTHRADASLRGKLRRRLVRLHARRPAAHAATRPLLSFSFDDAPASALREGAAILEARGMSATYFVCAGLDGLSGPMGAYGTADDLRRAHARGHEIACHTFSHMDVGAASASAVTADLDRNARALAALGLPPPETFAYPFGDVGFAAKGVAGARFRLARGLHHGVVGLGSDLAQAPAVGVEGDRGEALARHWLDRLTDAGGWLILFSHAVTDAPSAFGMSAQALAALADAATARGVEVVTVREGARRLGP